MQDRPNRKYAVKEEIELHTHLAREYIRRRESDGSACFEAYWNQEIMTSLSCVPKQAVLDCCCGDGILLPPLADCFEKVAGLDISREMLALARETSKSANRILVNGDAAELPFKNEIFDAAIFRGSFHHLPDPISSLKEIRRVLKSGGVVLFVEPNGDPAWMRAFRRAYYKLSPKFSSTHRSFRLHELNRLLTDAGLQPLAGRRMFFFSYPFAGLLDHFPFLKNIPLHTSITKAMIRLDKLLAGLPLINRWGLALVVTGWKPE